MNKRLKELSRQAGFKNWGYDEELERFAKLVRQDYLRELKALQPVAWLATEKFAKTMCSITTVTLHQQINGIPLYALEEVKDEPTKP